MSSGQICIAEPELPIEAYFLRPVTHALLRRYLYASMQPCRIASTLDIPIGRGWASSRPVRSFEDALIFIHDMERCINSLNSLDRAMLTGIVIQEWTQVETAGMLGMSVRALSYKFPAALDRLTQKLIAAELIVLPEENEENDGDCNDECIHSCK